MTKYIIDCERMKYPYTGLYYYCLYLGKSLLPQLKHSSEELNFYIPQKSTGIFGKEVGYIKQHSFQKFILPSLKEYSLWHSTYQGTNYFPKHRNIKIVFTIHDLNFMHDDKKSLSKKKLYLKKIQDKIDRADQITTISNFTLDEVKRYLELRDKKPAVIYNGCTLQAIDQLQAPLSKISGNFLYTIGTIVEKKNFHVLPCLLAKNDLKLVISGITQDQLYKEKILSEAAKWNVADRVVFTGPVSENDKQWFFENCTAFVFPSIAEGFGLPVIEAMYFGKTVFLSSLCSLPEIGGDQAYYFNSFDAAHMQDVLYRNLYKDDALKRQKIKLNAARFNWSDIAKQYLHIYRTV